MARFTGDPRLLVEVHDDDDRAGALRKLAELRRAYPMRGAPAGTGKVA